MTDTPVSFPVHGRSLRAAAADDRPIIFELLALRYYRKDGGAPFPKGRRWYGARRGDFNLVWSEEDDVASDAARAYQLFDVEADPRELTDLAAREPDRIDALRRSFEAELERARRDAARYRRGGRAQPTAAEVEQLRSLGYLAPWSEPSGRASGSLASRCEMARLRRAQAKCGSSSTARA